MMGLVAVAVLTLALPLLLPVAGVSINMGLLVSVGVVIGFLSGLLGVGGGFLTTPILMMIIFPPVVAAASDTNAIVATSASGVAAHFRLKNVDFKMGAYCLLGGLLWFRGWTSRAVKLLGARGNVDFLISVLYVVILGGMGGFMVYNSVEKLRRAGSMSSRKKHQVQGERIHDGCWRGCRSSRSLQGPASPLDSAAVHARLRWLGA